MNGEENSKFTLSANTTNTIYEFISSPKPVGCWILYGETPPHTAFMMYKKPTDEQIKNTEQLLGWTWKDAE